MILKESNTATKRIATNLGPALPVPDLVLVLEMADHLGFAGQGPLEAAAVGRGVLLGRADPDVGHMHLAGGLVDGVHQALHEDVHLRVFIAVVGNFEAVI